MICRDGMTPLLSVGWCLGVLVLNHADLRVRKRGRCKMEDGPQLSYSTALFLDLSLATSKSQKVS